MKFASALAAVVGVVISLSNIAEAQIYQWVDEKGTVNYSDRPPQEQSHAGPVTIWRGGTSFAPAPATVPPTAAPRPGAAGGGAVTREAAAAPHEGQTDKQLRPVTGKFYTDEELKGLFIVCAFMGLGNEPKQRELFQLCEQIIALHEAAKEDQAYEVMKKAAPLLQELTKQ